jgi:hypothetical protein
MSINHIMMLIININFSIDTDKCFNEILIAERINRVFSILKGLRSQKLKRIMRWLIKRVLFNVKSVQVPRTGKNPRIKRDGVLSESVLTRFYCILLFIFLQYYQTSSSKTIYNHNDGFFQPTATGK